MITALQIIGGLALLFIGGEMLVRGAVALAKELGLPIFVIGLTVVAYGTSSPEMVISVQAALGGHADIALGNVIGSNISNILCVLGLTAIISPILIDKKLSLTDSLCMLAATILLYIFCFFGDLSRITGVVFLVVLAVYTYLIFRIASKKKDNIPAEAAEEIEAQIKVKLNLWQSCGLCLVGVLLLIFGGDTLIKGAVTLAKIAGLSEAVIGVTLVAFGGSVPELVTSVIAAFHKRSEIVFGNIIGSNIFNILGIMGVTTLLRPIEVEPSFISFDLPIVVAATAFLCLLIYLRPRIPRAIGVVFFAGYVAYILTQFGAI